MDSSAKLAPDQQQALLQLIQEMSSIFWGPDPDKSAVLLRESFFDPFEKINAVSGLRISKELNESRSIIKSFKDANALYFHLEEAYVSLFISDRGGVTAPLYASCYVNTESGEKALLMGEPALDMKNRFESKGLSLADEIHEPQDHLSIELEYLYFLLDSGWSNDDHNLSREAATFAADVMLPWISKFQTRLAAEKKRRFYPLMALILKAILQIIAGLNQNFENGE